MEHRLCTNPECNHEWDSNHNDCDWCGAPGKVIAKSEPPPYDLLLAQMTPRTA